MSREDNDAGSSRADGNIIMLNYEWLNLIIENRRCIRIINPSGCKIRIVEVFMHNFQLHHRGLCLELRSGAKEEI